MLGDQPCLLHYPLTSLLWHYPVVTPACLQYMDRIYVKQANKAPVHQLGLNLWRDVVVRHRGIKERLLTLVLNMIQVGWVRFAWASASTQIVKL